MERSFAWLTKFRRLVRDYEALPATHEAKRRIEEALRESDDGAASGNNDDAD